MSGISNNYDDAYLKAIQQEAFTRMDSTENGGNGDKKVTTDEAYRDLNIGYLINGQNAEDAAKIKEASANIKNVLANYAGADGVFTATEWANFLNGSEWNTVLDVWHASDKKAQLEMTWIDNAHSQDGQTTKGEIKVGIIQNLQAQNNNIDTTTIEALIDKYAGEDGTFTLKEYQAMKKDPEYKAFVEQHGAKPWFRFNS